MDIRKINSHETCATQCLNAHRACLNTLDHCLEQGGGLANPDHLRLLRICAEVSRTSAFVLLSHSDFHHRTCAVCAEICNSCADSCAAYDDQTLSNCAQVCRECAESCIAMSEHLAA